MTYLSLTSLMRFLNMPCRWFKLFTNKENFYYFMFRNFDITDPVFSALLLFWQCLVKNWREERLGENNHPFKLILFILLLHLVTQSHYPIFSMSSKVVSRFIWSQVVLIKNVHYCIKIIIKLVTPKFDLHSYDFKSLQGLKLAGLCTGALSPASWRPSSLQKS